MTLAKDLGSPPGLVALLRWTGGLGAVTAEALALARATRPATARAKLGAAHRAGLLDRHRVLAQGPTLYVLSRAGMRRSGLRGLEACRVSASNARHLSACATVAGALECRYRAHRLMGERELRRDERELGRPLASALMGRRANGGLALHRPDLVLWPTGSGPAPVGAHMASAGARIASTDRDLAPAGSHRAAGDPAPAGYGAGAGDLAPVVFEVELTIKAPPRLTEICRAWARCRAVAGVVYIAPPEVARALERAIARARAGDRIVVVGLDAVL